MIARQLAKTVTLAGLHCLAALVGRRVQPAILMYHSFDDSTWKYSVSPDELRKQLTYLKETRTIVSLADIVAWVNEEKDLPDNALVITVDDGYADTYEVLYSLTKELQMPFTLFLTTDLSPQKKLGDLPRISWEQVKEMHDSGLVEIGVHGHTHQNFTVALKDNTLETEVETSRQLIKEHLGFDPKFIAYPAGRQNSNVVRRVKNFGFTAACATTPGTIRPGDDPFLLKRIGVDRETPMALFKQRLGKGFPLYVALLRFLRQTGRKLKKVFGLLAKLLRGQNPLEISLPQSHWDKQFESGYWNFLLDAPVNVQYIVSYISEHWGGKNPRILDVGCGNGVIPKLLKENGLQFDYIGTDISEAALEQARQHLSEGTFVRAGMEQPPELDGTFDIVIFSEVLLYGNARKTLQAHDRFITPDTAVIISLYRNWRTWVIWRQIRSLFKATDCVDLRDNSWGSAWTVCRGTLKRRSK